MVMRKVTIFLLCVLFEWLIATPYTFSNNKNKISDRKERRNERRKQKESSTENKEVNQTYTIPQDSMFTDKIVDDIPEEKNEPKAFSKPKQTSKVEANEINKKQTLENEEKNNYALKEEERNEHWGLKILAVIVTFFVVGKIKKKQKERIQKEEEKQRIKITKRTIEKRVESANTLEDLLECNKDIFKHGPSVRDFYAQNIENKFNEIKYNITPIKINERIADDRHCYLKTQGEIAFCGKMEKASIYIFKPKKDNQNIRIEWLFENVDKKDGIALKSLIRPRMESPYRVCFTREDGKPAIKIEGETILVLTLLICYLQE